MHLSLILIVTSICSAQVYYPHMSSQRPSLTDFRSSLIYDSYPEWPTFGLTSPFSIWEDNSDSVLTIPIYDSLSPYTRSRPDDRINFIQAAGNLYIPDNKDQVYSYTHTPKPNVERTPPPYYQSLQKFDNLTLEIKKRSKVTDTTADNPFISMVYVIQHLAQEVVNHGWRYYEKNYKNLVLRFINKAAESPQMTSKHVNCILDKSHETIDLIRKLLDNNWVNYPCKVQLGCDIFIDSFVKIIAEEELYREAVQLLLLGDEATSLLNLYPQLFDSLQDNDLMLFFMNSKDLISSILYTVAIIRQTNERVFVECLLQDSRYNRGQNV